MSSLDQRINRLLESRPLRPREGFVDGVLAAAEAEAAPRPRGTDTAPAPLRFALPAAAVLAFALVFTGFLLPGPDRDGATSALTTAEVEEILLLTEALPVLDSADSSGFRADGLLQTLETLKSES